MTNPNIAIDTRNAEAALAAFLAAPVASRADRATWSRDDFELLREQRREHYITHAGPVAAALEALLAQIQLTQAAAPTPPADDVREAVREAVASGFEAYAFAMRPGTYVSEYIADAILADFEVRPYGTVTEAEVDLIQESLYDDFREGDRLVIRAALEKLRALSTYTASPSSQEDPAS